MSKSIFLCLAIFFACAHSTSSNDAIDPGDHPDASEAGSTLPPSTDAAEIGTHCSDDLHQVLDQTNAVVQTCPPDQGCGLGGCVPACDSAAQNKSSMGCDYYSVEPELIQPSRGGCFAAYLTNTWGVPITISASFDGKDLDIAQIARISSGKGTSITYSPLPGGKLPPDQIAILFLAETPGMAVPIHCPLGIVPGINVEGATVGTAIGKAFHIKTSAPVAAYDIYPFGGGWTMVASATLLLPTTVWGDNYIGVAPFEKAPFTVAQQTLSIAASEPNTQVTINPTAAIVGGPKVAPTPKGVPQTYTLNAGEVLQFTQDAQLTGSAIQSTKPIGVWAGSTCVQIDVNSQFCDGAHQELPPVDALGHEYVAVRYRNRIASHPDEIVPWRIVGAVDGTALSYFPSTPAGAPSTTGYGTLSQFWGTGPFVVRSQDAAHPFYISAHMTGAEHAPATGTGDPEFVNIVPVDQFLSRYVFFTDVTYPNTNLVLIRKDGGAGMKDVTLDCAGNVTGWKPIAGSPYEWTTVDLTIDYAPQGKCDNGRHTIASAAPFGLTVWGWGYDGSYAYPAGASVQPINTVVVPANPK